MGAPVKIIDIAHRMIRLAGLEPETDVKIDIVGIRPGEKLYEELFDEGERRLPSSIPGIIEAETNHLPLRILTTGYDTSHVAAAVGGTSQTTGLSQKTCPS